VLEHVTTREGVEFVREAGPNVAATITAHHLVINRNALFSGGLRPHMYCLPVAKRELHRQVLRRAATSGEGRFFLGTDSAPHPARDKESACGCAGIFTAATALEIYLQVFEEEGALDRFEAFASLNGPRFYGLPINETRAAFERRPSSVPERVAEAAGTVIPFRSAETLRWSLVA
jgi:dihydroorotase